ncbi:MAG: DEAD/DEAH box helicase family protein, partial [Deltaproteobacteria bacterium]|nr:DEAD/DEAH box helicase family protein [Deltaproteobacteria bacterium]
MPLGEADTRAKLIDPAIHSRGWTEDFIRREETAGAIEIIEGKPRKQAKGRVDYVLRIKVNPESQPVAVALIEAKAENLPPTHGLEQAKAYGACKRLNVKFVYSSNGHLFVEYDLVTGQTSKPRPLSEFPTPAHLRQRYEAAVGFSLSDPAAQPLLARYPGGEATRRYYQDAAIRAVLEKVARCEKNGEPKRALLSLATGSGKTFIAVNTLKRIADAGQLKQALFVCDRDELRQQGLGAFQNVFGSDAAEVYRKSDGTNNAKNARLHVATYQTLGVDTEEADANFLTTFYPEHYFSHIVIDECHRSAWGKWSQVLTRNPAAVQIGLTATPRKLEITERTKEAQADAKLTADNLDYFGEPVYEYDMSQGIEDGYLAACEIHRFDLFHDNKQVNERESGISRGDLSGKDITDAITGETIGQDELRERYAAPEIEDRILIPERVAAMCKDLFDHLLETSGPEQKTIIFCTRDRHADDVASAMNNLYAEWCAKNGKQRLERSRHHFIATTVDLLTTGVDVPVVSNIVFFKYVRSPIAFYQMVGRGTRIDLPSNKLMFRVYDYTDATRLFGAEFKSKFTPPRKPKEGPGPEPPEPPERAILVEGFDIRVSDAGRYIVTQVDGKAMPVTVEEYKQRLAAKLVEGAPTLEKFRANWIEPPKRRELLGKLPDAGRSALLVRSLEEMTDFDLYDVLGEIGYGLAPKRRTERADAFNYKHQKWLDGLPVKTSATLKALASQFSRAGTDGLENPQVFQT